MRARSIAKFFILGVLLSPNIFHISSVHGIETLNLCQSGLGITQIPIWVAQDTGAFVHYGTKVRIIFIQGGTTSARAMVAGDVPVCNISGSAVVNATLAGADLVMISGSANTLTYSLVAHPSIRSPSDLRGKTLAVSGIGGATEIAVRLVLKKYGINPERDVTFVTIGTEGDRLAAVQRGHVAATMSQAPFTLMAKKSGLRLMASLADLDIPYQHVGLATSSSFIRREREALKGLLRGYAAGIHYLKSQPVESKKIIARHLRLDSAELVDEVYREFAEKIVPEIPYPTLEGIKTILGEAAKIQSKASLARASDFVDLTLIQELEGEGFFKKLYGK